MANNSEKVQLKQSKLSKNSKEIIGNFSVNDIPKLKKTLLDLTLDYMSLAPDELADQGFREDIVQMYRALETLMDNIKKYQSEIAYEIERRVG